MFEQLGSIEPCKCSFLSNVEWSSDTGMKKNTINIKKHGIDFEDAKDIFKHPILVMKDTRDSYDDVLEWFKA